jgi:ribosomal protein S18 acetylase RimI-like enzyme
MAEGIEIRRLTEAEAAVFRDIRLEALVAAPDAFSSIFAHESDQPLSFFAGRIGGGVVFGAFRGAELLGVAGFYMQPGPKHAHKGTLWGMYVRPTARRLGVGKLLVEAVVKHARTAVEILQLSVVSDNLAARRLYAGIGFEEYGVEKRAAKYRGRYHDDVLMAKTLVAPASGEADR